MKTCITLVFAAISFYGAAATPQGFSEIDMEANISATNLEAKATNPKFYVLEEDVLNPSVFISSGYIASPLEVITANNEVIGYNPVFENKRPLLLERTMADLIAEDRLIIEAVPIEFSPLDFGYINKKKELKVPLTSAKL